MLKKIIHLSIFSTFLIFTQMNSALACSVAPTKTINRNGIQEAQATSSDFVITGKIIGTQLVPSRFDKTVKVNALSVKVISSENNKAQPGDVLYFYSYDISDSMCHGKFKEIDPKRYTKDSIVRVINRDSAIPDWELGYRLILIKTTE